MPRLPADLDEPLARQLAGLGLRVLTTHFQPSPAAVAVHASRVRSVLADQGISIVQATGYNPQLTHPDDALWQRSSNACGPHSTPPACSAPK